MRNINKKQQLDFTMGGAHTLLAALHNALAVEASDLLPADCRVSTVSVEMLVRAALSACVRGVNGMYGGYSGVLNDDFELRKDPPGE